MVLPPILMWWLGNADSNHCNVASLMDAISPVTYRCSLLTPALWLIASSNGTPRGPGHGRGSPPESPLIRDEPEAGSRSSCRICTNFLATRPQSPGLPPGRTFDRRLTKIQILPRRFEQQLLSPEPASRPTMSGSHRRDCALRTRALAGARWPCALAGPPRSRRREGGHPGRRDGPESSRSVH